MTSQPGHNDSGLTATRIPADIARDDQVLGPLTARQTAILATAAVILWLGYLVGRTVMAPLAYVALVAPVAAVVTAIALGRRDGIAMDRFLIAAVRFWRTPKRRVMAPEGVPALPDVVPRHLATAAGPAPAAFRLPCEQVLDPGVLDLGGEGHAALATCSTVNFDLHAATEQQALTGAFARWLNSLTGPAQVIIRAHRLDIAPLADELVANAPTLPHPALEQAALDHAAFLRELGSGSDLLTRHALLVLREPKEHAGHSRTSAAARVRHRAAEAARGLATAGITVSALEAAQITAAVAAACDPDSPTPVPVPAEGGASCA